MKMKVIAIKTIGSKHDKYNYKHYKNIAIKSVAIIHDCRKQKFK